MKKFSLILDLSEALILISFLFTIIIKLIIAIILKYILLFNILTFNFFNLTNLLIFISYILILNGIVTLTLKPHLFIYALITYSQSKTERPRDESFKILGNTIQIT